MRRYKIAIVCLSILAVFAAVFFSIALARYAVSVQKPAETIPTVTPAVPALPSTLVSASEKIELPTIAPVETTPQPTSVLNTDEKNEKPIIVLDPGHGKSSGTMSKEEKLAAGWIFDTARQSWGEWRHWKSGTTWQDCQGSGCIGRSPAGGSCWYPIGDGDRNTEPNINLQNCMYAKAFLEDMGYQVRMTRTSNQENPSMTQRLTYCYPGQDTGMSPDADLFVCVHSNAGGGRGSYCIALSGTYDQAGIPEDYIEQGNSLGKAINDRIVAQTSLCANSNGMYYGYPELILFCKSPIPIAYLEIGFFDNAADLAILQTESSQIGKAIADGIDDFYHSRSQ